VRPRLAPQTPVVVLLGALVVAGLGAAAGSLTRALAGGVALFGIGLLVLAILRARPHGRREPFELAAAGWREPSIGGGRPDRLATFIALSEHGAGDADHLLRPVLVEVAGEWLLATHGVRLADAGAGSLLPAELWEWVRPDRPRPTDPHAPGLRRDQIETLLDQLEALS
jgi:hypothetical protein